MEKIPLQARLRREIHRKTAQAQDLIVKEVYSVIDKAVLHGGTAIWRCYHGNRFSEDLDFYFPKDTKKIDLLFNKLIRIGFSVVKKKISEKGLYSEFELNRVSVRLEATFQNIHGILCDYEMSDGIYIPVYSLTAEQFVAEKAGTYLKRRKIRDLWDVYFLLKNVEDLKKINEVDDLIRHYSAPLDKENLKEILLGGVVPSADEMIGYIKRKWENKFI